MSQKNELNLVSLYQRQEQEEISESEMRVVVAGSTDNCNNCIGIESHTTISVSIDVGQCTCGSIWVIFGLAG